MDLETPHRTSMRSPFQLGIPILLAFILCALILVGLSAFNPAQAAGIWLFVDGANGSDTALCGQVATPCKTISYTLGTRAANDDTLLISAGVYTENLTITGINITLLGGYTISGTQWLPNTGETVIDGDGLDRTVFIHNSTATLENLTIQDGAANAMECWGDLLWATNATVTVRGSTFKDNLGGCVAIEINHDFGPSHLNLETSTVKDTQGNGALHVWGEFASATVEDVTFDNNASGEFGGGVRVDFNATATISNSRITNNTAQLGGGGVMVMDGGSAEIHNSQITSNSSPQDGGGVRVEGGSLLISNSSLVENYSANGQSGAIDLRGGTLEMLDSVATGNWANQHGGFATVLPGSTFTITNVLVNDHATTTGNANVFAINGGDVIVMNSTIVENNPQAAQAVILWSGNMTVTNTIMWDNAFNLQADPPCPDCFQVTYSDIQGGFTGAGNIDEDPMFAGADDFRLQMGSPCVDTGTDAGAPDHDLLQTQRPLDGDGDDVAVTDMGAYELILSRLYLPLILADYSQ